MGLLTWLVYLLRLVRERALMLTYESIEYYIKYISQMMLMHFKKLGFDNKEY